MLYKLRIITDKWMNEEGDWYENDGYWYGEGNNPLEHKQFEIPDKHWKNAVQDIVYGIMPPGDYWVIDYGDSISIMKDHGDEAIEAAYLMPVEDAGCDERFFNKRRLP